MEQLRIVRATGGVALEDWRTVHNLIIPADALGWDDMVERAGRNRLDVAYTNRDLVGCSTVRPPAPQDGTATVIARILPEFRGRGLGTALYEAALAAARALGPRAIETVVWAANDSGVRFAEKHGFAEVERYSLDEGAIPYLTMRLTD